MPTTTTPRTRRQPESAIRRAAVDALRAIAGAVGVGVKAHGPAIRCGEWDRSVPKPRRRSTTIGRDDLAGVGSPTPDTTTGRDGKRPEAKERRAAGGGDHRSPDRFSSTEDKRSPASHENTVDTIVGGALGMSTERGKAAEDRVRAAHVATRRAPAADASTEAQPTASGAGPRDRATSIDEAP